MNAIDRRMVLPLALAFGVVALVVVTQVATATHPRPRGASPVRVSLVQAFRQCEAPNRQHGGGLVYLSCSPPEPTSKYVTVGTPDANGAEANSVGFVRIEVRTTSPVDILFTGTISDVRCLPDTAASRCANANDAGGPDYTGDMQGEFSARITDHFNGPIGSSSGGTDAATVQDTPDDYFIFHCFSTPDKSVGSTCYVDTSRPLIPAPYWFEGKRVNLQLTDLHIEDGGADGDVFTDDNTLFAVQGVFVP